MRWYNPALGKHEYRMTPADDREAGKLLRSLPESGSHLEVYDEWRHRLGASITQALIRVGEAAREGRND